MSGYIIKIAIEQTHPPVWRRVVIPEQISFYHLHQIIQTIFGWKDAHLHDFTFPNENFCVALPHVETGSRVLSEKNTIVDDFLGTFKWFRYTYDFGDNWRHKITFEKEDVNYDKRYATVLKAKGENFMEDSGGIWGEQADITEYSIEEVNAKLERVKFKKVKGTEKAKTIIQERGMLKDFEKMIDQLVKKMKKANKQVPSETVSVMDNNITAWKKFCEEKERFQKFQTQFGIETETNQMPVYEQISLPFVDLPEETVENNREECCILKTETKKSRKQILQDLKMQEVRDYCKYLQIPWMEKQNKQELLEMLDAELTEHPEYYLYLFYEEEFLCILNLLEQPSGPMEISLDENIIIKGMLLGLLETQITGKKEEKTANISIAADAKGVLLQLKKSNWKAIKKKIEKTTEQIYFCLQSYGVMELEVFYETYCKVWKTKISEKDFRRFVYWGLRQNGDIITATSLMDNKEYVSLYVIDMKKILTDIKKFSLEIPYRQIDREECRKWQQSFCEVYPCWNDYAYYLANNLGYDNSSLNQFLEKAFTNVENGAGCTELFQQILKENVPKTQKQWNDLWCIIMELVMKTGVPALKGFSRSQYGELTGRSPYTLPAVSEKGLVKSVQEDTQLYEMPANIQYQIYEIMNMEAENAKRAMKDLLSQTCKGNYAITFLLTEQ